MSIYPPHHPSTHPTEQDQQAFASAQERAKEVAKIERDIEALNGALRDMAMLVKAGSLEQKGILIF